MYPRGMNTRPYGGVSRPQRPMQFPRGSVERYPPTYRAPVRGRGPPGPGLLGNSPGMFGAPPRPRHRFFIPQDQSKFYRPRAQGNNQPSKPVHAPKSDKPKDVQGGANSKDQASSAVTVIEKEVVKIQEEETAKKEEEIHTEAESKQENKTEPPIQDTETDGQTQSIVDGESYQDVGGAMQEEQVVTGTEEEDDDEDDDDGEDTGFCKYCNMNFASDDAYWKHTRGLLHTQKLMEIEGGHSEDTGKEDQGHNSTGTENAAGYYGGATNYEEQEGYNEEGYGDYGGYEEEGYGEGGYEAGGGGYVASEESNTTKGGHRQEEYNFNTANWMDVDKPEPKMPVDKRDYVPDDIGRNQFPDEFYCHICDIRCTGMVTFQMHTEGSKHKMKVEQCKMMGERGMAKVELPQTAKPRVIDSNREARLHQTIKKYDVPLIGLQFVTEFQKADPSAGVRYVCNLCESKCDGNTIVAHLSGHKHRVAYFKQCRPDIFNVINTHISSKKKSEISAASEQFARDVQEKDGQGKVKVKIEIDKATEKATSKLLMSGGIAFDSLIQKIQSSSDDGTNSNSSQGPDVKRPKFDASGYSGFDPNSPRNKGFRMAQNHKPPHQDFTGYKNTENDDYNENMKNASGFYGNKPDSSRKRPFSYLDRPVKGNPFRPNPSHEGPTEGQYVTGGRQTDRLHTDRERQYNETFRQDEPYQPRSSSRPPLSSPYGVTDRQVDRPPYSTMDRRTEIPSYGRADRSTNPYTNNSVEVFDYGHSNTRIEELPPKNKVQQKEEEPVDDEDADLFQQFLKWKKQQKAVEERTSSSENADTVTTAPPKEKTKPKSKEEENTPNVSDLLLNLSNSMINTEEEAAMALQVSNALTQALLQYRLKNVPKDLLSTESLTATKPSVKASSPAARKPQSRVKQAASDEQRKQKSQTIPAIVSAVASTVSTVSNTIPAAQGTNVDLSKAYAYSTYGIGTLPTTNVVPGVTSGIPVVTQASQVPSDMGVPPPGYQYNTASYLYQQSQMYYNTPYTAAQQAVVPPAATTLAPGTLPAYSMSTAMAPGVPQMVPAPPSTQPEKPPPPPPLSQTY